MYKNFLPGLLFAVLWASGGIAAKFGMRSVDGLMLAGIRFLTTGILFAPYFLIHKKYRFWPHQHEWKPIIIYGFLNSTLTLGSFFAAQKYAPAGISMLFTAVAPLLIALFSAWMLKRRLTQFEVMGMLIAFAGLLLAAGSAFKGSSITPEGFGLLVIYMMAYAASSIYISRVKVDLPNMVFNIWQVFIGGILVLPFCWLLNSYHIKRVDSNLILSLAWLIIMLSFIANLLWLHLVQRDTVSAATWLYLVPVMGFIYGHFLLGEQVSIFAIIGGAMVITGLIISKRKGKKQVQPV